MWGFGAKRAFVSLQKIGDEKGKWKCYFRVNKFLWTFAVNFSSQFLGSFPRERLAG
jgi:hypothetical protein